MTTRRIHGHLNITQGCSITTATNSTHTIGSLLVASADIVKAYERGVSTVTFDTETELDKIASLNLPIKCILRIYAKDPHARCQFAHKFGCPKENWDAILQKAKRYNLDIMGISFHVGSGASSSDAYALAIQDAYEFKEMALQYDYTMKIIDIGGGFVSHNLQNIPETIVESIQKYFPDKCTTIIAEPGRFFAETSGYLVSNVIDSTGDIVNIITRAYY